MENHVLPQKPEDTCKIFGLCRSSKEEQLTLPHRATDENTPSAALGSADRNHVSVRKQKSKVKQDQILSLTCCSLQAMFNPTCALCLFVIKKLESLLPTNVTEVTLVVNMSFIT